MWAVHGEALRDSAALYDTQEEQAWLADMERQEEEERAAMAKRAALEKLERKRRRAEARQRFMNGDMSGLVDDMIHSSDEDSDLSGSVTGSDRDSDARSAAASDAGRRPRLDSGASLRGAVARLKAEAGARGSPDGGDSESTRGSVSPGSAASAEPSTRAKQALRKVVGIFQAAGQRHKEAAAAEEAATPTQKALRRAMRAARHSFRLARTTRKLRERHDSLRGVGVLTSTTYLYCIRTAPVLRVGLVLETSAFTWRRGARWWCA